MRKSIGLVWIMLALPLVGTAARGDLIFESATAVVASTRGDTMIQGRATDATFFSGVNFQLTSTTQITSIGGHFGTSGGGNNQLFGEILAASSLASAPDVSGTALASTLIALTPPSRVNGNNVLVTDTLAGSVNVTLGPGFYSLIFGSGLFGATGSGTTVETVTGPNFTGAVNTQGVSTYSYRRADGVLFAGSFGDRYFVNGVAAAAVPEPTSLLMVALGVSGAGLVVARRRTPRRIAR